jgi:hypothetical protein
MWACLCPAAHDREMSLDGAQRTSGFTSLDTASTHMQPAVSQRVGYLQNYSKLRSETANELALGVHQSIAEPSLVNVLHRMQGPLKSFEM